MNLTENEIHILKSLKSNTEKITKEFGLIKLAQINVKKREQDAISMLNTLRSEEKQVVEVLEKKYGRGSIDIDRGTFTPSK
tara:strand:+ start:893 stop:1135 length:243 start_codon:yes stop_codon:yes gene_type:complete